MQAGPRVLGTEGPSQHRERAEFNDRGLFGEVASLPGRAVLLGGRLTVFGLCFP